MRPLFLFFFFFSVGCCLLFFLSLLSIKEESVKLVSEGLLFLFLKERGSFVLSGDLGEVGGFLASLSGEGEREL